MENIDLAKIAEMKAVISSAEMERYNYMLSKDRYIEKFSKLDAEYLWKHATQCYNIIINNSIDEEEMFNVKFRLLEYCAALELKAKTLNASNTNSTEVNPIEDNLSDEKQGM